MQSKSLGVLAALLLFVNATVTLAQGGEAGGAVGAPAGVPGAAGNTSSGFGRSGDGGSAGTSSGPTNPTDHALVIHDAVGRPIWPARDRAHRWLSTFP
jgi:hypothetical protein